MVSWLQLPFSERISADLITGYNDYQIYLLLSCAPIQGHIAGLVDIPNACTTIGLPMDIFDFNISPHVPAEKRDMGTCAFASS
jgi:formamidase